MSEELYEMNFETGKLEKIDTSTSVIYPRGTEIQIQGYEYSRYVITGSEAHRNMYKALRIPRELDEHCTIDHRAIHVDTWNVFPKDSDRQGICFKITGKEYLENFVLEAEYQYEKALSKHKEEEDKAKTLRNEKIEKGKDIYIKLYGDKKPKAVYLAELHINESDSQSDYFGSKVDNTIVLGGEFEEKKFSFANLKKLASKLQDVIGVLDKENRENYSGGNGNYLTSKTGTRYSGWQAFRTKYFRMEDIYLSLSERSMHLTLASPEPLPEINAEGITILDYSDKAVAIVGDTKPIKDKLMELGCKFNPRLSCGPGRIASKKNVETIKKELNK